MSNSASSAHDILRKHDPPVRLSRRPLILPAIMSSHGPAASAPLLTAAARIMLSLPVEPRPRLLLCAPPGNIFSFPITEVLPPRSCRAIPSARAATLMLCSASAAVEFTAVPTPPAAPSASLLLVFVLPGLLLPFATSAFCVIACNA